MAFLDEVSRLPEWLDGAGPKVNLALFLVTLGTAAPYFLGLQYLDPLVITGLALTAVVFVAATAGEAGRNVAAPTLAPRIGALAAGGMAYAVAVMALGVASVNLRNWHGSILLPAGLACLTAPLLALALAAFLAAEGVIESLDGRRPREIGTRFRWATLMLVFAFYFRDSWMPEALSEWIGRRLTTQGIALGSLVAALALGTGAIWKYRKARKVLYYS